MALGLQPSRLLADHLQTERQAGRTVFKFTAVAPARLDDLLTRQKEVGFSTEEEIAEEARECLAHFEA